MTLPPRPHRAEPLPGDRWGERLCQTFTYLWQAIVKPNEPESDWITITGYPLTPRALWRYWQDANQLVGVRFEQQTHYALIDLDIHSPYHPQQDPQALSLLRAALETIGITRSFLTQSSWSKGLHLWIPLPEKVSTFDLATALKQSLEAQGFELKAGQLETFPNCKRYAQPGEYSEYNAHRLPLQPASGSQLLDNDLQPIAGELDRFFELWDQCAAGQDMQQLDKALNQARQNRSTRYISRKSLKVETWRTDIETEISEGWTGYGQTNHLLKTIACQGVVFQGLTGEALATYVWQTAIASPSYETWCRHQHEIKLRSTVWARAAENYYWRLGSSPKRQGNIHAPETANAIVPFERPLNQQRAEDAQQRIKAAIAQLEAEEALPEPPEARAQAIIAIARCSKQTLGKYKALWHPEQYPSQSVCTVDPKPITAAIKAPPLQTPEILEPLSDKDVHTFCYMKGITAIDCEFPHLQIPSSDLGGSGGLSTGFGVPVNAQNAASLVQPNWVPEAAEIPLPENVPAQPLPTISAFLPSQDLPCLQPRNGRKADSLKVRNSIGVSLPASPIERFPPEEWRSAIANQLRRLGWTLDRVKQFIAEQLPGKTLQTLSDDDRLLLLYRLQTLDSKKE